MKRARIPLVALVVLMCLQSAYSDDKPATKPTVTDFRRLKELMPDELGGIRRSHNEGEKMNIGDFIMSHATAEYAKAEAGEKDPSIRLEITDYGSNNPMAAGMVGWQTLQIDKESDNGYEKTTKIKDQPAYETYQNEGKSGQVQVWIGGRFLVNLQTTNLSPEDLKKVTDALPVDKLAEMK